MPVNLEVYRQILADLQKQNIALVAVSKTRPVSDIMQLYAAGQRDFGENYVQELVEKQALLPKDIRWHFIGHLQRNKVRQIAPFVYLVQSVDSLRLLKEINIQGEKNKRIIPCLLQVHIAQEETKFGFDQTELDRLFEGDINEMRMLSNCCVAGLMGMASFSNDAGKVRGEFHGLSKIFDQYKADFTSGCLTPTLSMGMSADYKTAIVEGSNLVRIGSLLFGERIPIH